MVELQNLKLDKLASIDGGRFAEAFNRHLMRCGEDCYDRPGDSKARKVTLTVEITPKLDQNGMCEGCDVQMDAKTAVPPHRSKVFDMRLKPNGELYYRQDSLDNADQHTMDFGDE